MKHSFQLLLLSAITVLFSFTASAQEQESNKELPQWISTNGYWVVESNKKTPKDAIVYFYNNNNVLVYKEEIRNQKLKLNRTKTLLRLKSALDDAIIAYEQGTWNNSNMLLAKHLKQ